MDKQFFHDISHRLPDHGLAAMTQIEGDGVVKVAPVPEFGERGRMGSQRDIHPHTETGGNLFGALEAI